MKKVVGWLVVSLIVLGLSGNSFGAGFALIEQSVKGLGTAYSGGAAVAEDPSTVFFNPAGMTRIEGRQATGALHIIMPSTKFKKQSATNVAGTDLTGGNGGDGGVLGIAPNAYYVETFDKGWSFGLGLNAPFGLATEYDKDWVGRYHAVESDMMTININPSVAHKVNDKFSYGFGVSLQYISATLSSMLDGGLFIGGAAASQTGDVFSEMEADDWSFGYNLGFLYEFNDKTRAGFSYRSEIAHELEGDVTFSATNPTSAAYIAGGQFPNQGVGGKIDLPASAQLSVYHQFNDQLAVMADVMWTQWSSFEKLVINFDQGILGGAVTSTTTTENWEDNWRYSLGMTYKPVDDWTLRTGLAYDETPIPDEHRTPRIPGTDRLWLALGAGFEKGPWNFDFGFVHLFIDDSEISQTIAVPAPTDENFSRGNLVGEFENGVEILSAEISYKF